MSPAQSRKLRNIAEFFCTLDHESGRYNELWTLKAREQDLIANKYMDAQDMKSMVDKSVLSKANKNSMKENSPKNKSGKSNKDNTSFSRRSSKGDGIGGPRKSLGRRDLLTKSGKGTVRVEDFDDEEEED